MFAAAAALRRRGVRLLPRTPLSSSPRFFSSSSSSRPLLSSSRSSSSSLPPFDKVLIANRGEIACRVVRTCRRLGVRTVAVYSDADGPECLHASMADECYKIGVGPSPGESYLRGEEVLDVALRTGAQAIHPGYGFLSENPTFATLLSQSSVSFIGPPPGAIESMGSKSRSKSIMEEAGVPCTPGYHSDSSDGQSEERLLHEAVENVGFPLLIKAVMGGGGKGMRLVHSPSDFLPALESCRRESLKAFGDDRVILEKYLVDPRHVEVQVCADTHGNGVHLYERDCSLQRRHQKIIEEAPASDLPMELREEMGNMAVKAAQAVGYVNAGTVEFLLDTQATPDKEKGGGGGYYFCEMNTRLQVEHPITELITGVDLVEWQLRVAAGEELPITDQSNIPCMGHAMEARIYAENPLRDFLPSAGEVWHHDTPAPSNVGAVPLVVGGGPDGDGDGCVVRVDSGIKPTKSNVSVYYDPMISKLIVHSPSHDSDEDPQEVRARCLNALVTALKRYRLSGVPTNIPFLIECAQHPGFAVGGKVDTGFLDRHGDEILGELASQQEEERPLERAIAALAASLLLEDRVGLRGCLEEAKRSSGGGGPWSNLSGSWRMGGTEGRFKRTFLPFNDDEHGSSSGGGGEASSSPPVECTSNPDGSFDVKITHSTEGGTQCTAYSLDGRLSASGRMDVLLNGHTHLSFALASRENADEGYMELCLWNRDLDGAHAHIQEGEMNYAWSTVFEHPLPCGSSHSSSLGGGSAGSAGADGGARIKSPMPGKIVRILKPSGSTVKAGETILVMEAMKMEHGVSSPIDGVVEYEGGCEEGDTVEDGMILAVVRPATEEGEEEDERGEEAGDERTA